MTTVVACDGDVDDGDGDTGDTFDNGGAGGAGGDGGDGGGGGDDGDCEDAVLTWFTVRSYCPCRIVTINGTAKTSSTP